MACGSVFELFEIVSRCWRTKFAGEMAPTTGTCLPLAVRACSAALSLCVVEYTVTVLHRVLRQGLADGELLADIEQAVSLSAIERQNSRLIETAIAACEWTLPSIRYV